MTLPPGRARTRDQTRPDRVTGCCEDDRDNGRRLLCGQNCRRRVREYDVDLEADEFGRDLGKALRASLRPAILDRDVTTFDPTEFTQSLHKGSGPLHLGRRCVCAEKPYRRHRCLLRVRG